MKWPWQKKEKVKDETPVITTEDVIDEHSDAEPVVETVEDKPEKKKTTGLNLRNPDQKRAEEDEEDPLSQALAVVAADSMHKSLDECDSIFLTCTCGKSHFRHTGYLETVVPYVSGDGGKIANDSHPVKTCCACRKSYVSIGSKVYDVTDRVDIEAWEKFEKEAHRATGPGGEC